MKSQLNSSDKNLQENRKGWKNLVLFIIPYFFLVGIFQFIGTTITGIDLAGNFDKFTMMEHLIVSLFGFLGTFLVIFIFMKFVDNLPLIRLGFKFQKRWKDIFIGFVIGLVVMSLGFIILIFFKQVDFIETNFLGQEFVVTVILFLIISVVEETVFRGYVLRNLLSSLGNYPALMISAIVFSLMHAANPNLTWIGYLNLFLAGILLGLPYIYTRNLWFSIALHFSWNFFQSLFGFNVSGQDSYSIINFDISENNILNGGSFGFEGSILSIIFQISLISLMLYFYSNKSFR